MFFHKVFFPCFLDLCSEQPRERILKLQLLLGFSSGLSHLSGLGLLDLRSPFSFRAPLSAVHLSFAPALAGQCLSGLADWSKAK